MGTYLQQLKSLVPPGNFFKKRANPFLLATKKSFLHPKTKLPARRTPGDPVLRWMKLCDRRHSRDPLAPELRQLFPFCGVDIHEAIHITNAEPIDAVLGRLLPLCSETSGDWFC
jgi:hypothetical protein